MRIQFLGATGTVTGSKYLVEHHGSNLLVDCGLFQGLKELRLRNRSPLPLDVSRLEAVLLTHAHIDHSGYVPLLIKNGFKGHVYCTPATRELCEILLPDSGRLQEEEAGYANKKGYSKHSPALPLYTKEDAERSLSRFRVVDFDTDFFPDGEFRVSFRRAGHILGAAMVSLSTKAGRLLFTGDLGRPNDPLILPPEEIKGTDFLVMESTYGDRLHDPMDPLMALEQVVRRTVDRGGTVVVPAFAVGRSQLLLYYLHQLQLSHRLGNVPVFLDSPMSIDATQLFCRYQGEHRLSPEECRGISAVARHTRTPDESKAICRNPGPKIILSASGMATGGRVLHHLGLLAPDPRNTILFAGYQAVGTRGDAMLQGARSIKIHGNQVPVLAEVVAIHGLSAHADQQELLGWLSHFERPPKMTFITHGEPKPAAVFCGLVEKRLGWPCQVPTYAADVALS